MDRSMRPSLSVTPATCVAHAARNLLDERFDRAITYPIFWLVPRRRKPSGPIGACLFGPERKRRNFVNKEIPILMQDENGMKIRKSLSRHNFQFSHLSNPPKLIPRAIAGKIPASTVATLCPSSPAASIEVSRGAVVMLRDG
jgi:hypothetical protein